MRRLSLFALGVSLSCLSGAVAQSPSVTDETFAAHVAGYKAAFTCSATFNAGQSTAEIEENELTGIYPDYRATLAQLPKARIDEANKSVSVRYSPSSPPRIAVWRPGMGCTQLAPGSDISAAKFLPSFEGWTKNPDRDIANALGSNVTVTLNTDHFEAIDAPVTFAFDGATYGAGTKTSAVLVVQNGQIVSERYDRGIDADTPQRTWSVAKSITATIIGSAVYEGLLDLDHPAILKAWSSGADPRRAITLRNVLQMASGLESGVRGSRTDEVYFGGGRVVDNALTGSLEADPGTRFKYANNDTLIAMRALREKLGNNDKYLNYPYEKVLSKIGAFNTTLEVDWNGDFISSSQIWSTARDIARIGQLYLQNGRWGNQQIIHPDWIKFVSSAGAAQPSGNGFRYGGQFWLLGGEPGVPQGTFAALGHRGQYLVIIPSRNAVIVRRGYDESGGTRFKIAEFTRDIVRGLDNAKARKEASEQAERDAVQAEYEAARAAYEDELAIYNEEYGEGGDGKPKQSGQRTYTSGERLKRGIGK